MFQPLTISINDICQNTELVDTGYISTKLQVTYDSKRRPKTLAGKLVSQKNSFKHGLTAKNWINESEASRYSVLVTYLTKEHSPVGTLERFEIERIANCKVRLERIQ